MIKLERREEFIKGSLAGISGATVKYAFNELVQYIHIAKYDNNSTALGVVMKSWEHTTLYWILGFLNALIIGAFFGVIIAFMFSYIISDKYYLLKGAMIGVGIWLFNFGVMAKVFNYPKDIAASPGDVYSMLASLIIYAIVTTYCLKLLGFFMVKKIKRI